MSVRDESLKIGTVVSVDGAAITVEAERLSVRIDDTTEEHITVGSFVNCGGTHGDVLCVVTRAWQELAERRNKSDDETRILTDVKMVELVAVGMIEQGFRRGVERLPPVGCPAYFVTGDAFEALIGKAADDDLRRRLFPVGHRVGTANGKAQFDLDKFFGRHVAILGTTGSGKSYTVASLAQSVLTSYARPRLVFFDLHNEYGAAFEGERATCVGWSEFRLPIWMLSFDELVDICVGSVGGNQEAFLRKHLQAVREAAHEKRENDVVSVDTPVPFDWQSLVERLENEASAISDKRDRESIVKVIEKMKARRRDPRYAFLFEEHAKDAAAFFQKVFGLRQDDRESHVTVLDLSGLPAEIRAGVIGVLGRLFFEYKYWDIDPESLPIALVLEEAHSYIPSDGDAIYKGALESIERIAKEGRKYGLSLVVVSQRPANVSPTILSQCGTFVALRLTSDVDQERVLRLFPDTIGKQASLLSSLRDGEAIVSGDGVTLPGRVQFVRPSPPPRSKDVRYHKSWTDGPPDGYGGAGVVRRWLQQKRSI